MGASVDSLFARFVAVGDSLSQGTWNVGTTADSQPWGVPALVARQAGARFRLPLLEPPGNPPHIQPLSVSLTPRHRRVGWGQPLEPGLEIDNFAVPAARLEDVVRLRPADLAACSRPILLRSLMRRILNPLSRSELERLSQLDRAIAAQPSLVHVWIGANDVLESFFYPTATVTTPAEFRRQFHHLLRRLLSETSAEVIVVTVPELNIAPGLRLHRWRHGLMQRTGATIRAYNQILREVAAGQPRVLLVDINPGLAEADARGVSVEGWDLPYRVRLGKLTLAAPIGRPGELKSGGLISYDGLHPTRTGYAMLANAVIDSVNERFGIEVPLFDLAVIARHDALLCAPSPWLWSASALSQRITFWPAVATLNRQRWPIPRAPYLEGE